MNFELNDPTGTSLPSQSDSASTTESHRFSYDQQSETHNETGHERQQLPYARPSAASRPTERRARRQRLNIAALRISVTSKSTHHRAESSSPPSRLGADSAGPSRPQRPPSLRDIVEVGYSPDEMTSTGYKAILSAVSAFGLVLNNMPVQDIAMPTAYSCIEHLLACGRSWWRVTQDLVVLSSVVRRGKQLGLLPLDLLCAFDLYAHGRLKRTQVPAIPHLYRTADLQCLFSSDLYQSGHLDPLDLKAGRFWMPLVALFTGVRTGELGCAQVSDIERHETVWMLRVPSSPSAERARSAYDSRLVPLHPELVRCGFIRYVAQRKLAGETTLLPVSAGGTATAQSSPAGSRWFARYSQSIGLRPELRTLRALRSTFVLACILSGMGETTCAELAGLTRHRRPLAGETRSEPTSERLAAVRLDWIPQLRFDGLEVSHLHVHDPLAGVEEAFPTSAATLPRQAALDLRALPVFDQTWRVASRGT